jgi:hypothetical protein
VEVGAVTPDNPAASARQRGRLLGEWGGPRSSGQPDPERVRELRRQGLSSRGIAIVLGYRESQVERVSRDLRVAARRRTE